MISRLPKEFLLHVINPSFSGSSRTKIMGFLKIKKKR